MIQISEAMARHVQSQNKPAKISVIGSKPTSD